MAYGIEHGERLDDAVRRVAREQLEGALRELDAASERADASIHGVRKRMKKLRALARLIRPALGDATFQKENACYRDAAAELAGARAAAAMLGSFDALVRFGAGRFAPGTFADVRRLLSASHGEEVESAVDSGRQAVAAQLRAALARVDDWSLSGKGWPVIRAGLMDTYGRARKSFRAARREPSAEHLHEWRKWTKYHFHHLQLLEPTWPAVLGAQRAALKELSELLGDEHDLSDLRAALLSEPMGTIPHATLGPLLALLDERRDALRAEAWALGTRLFAEKPRAVERRLHQSYRAFRAGGAPAEEARPAANARTTELDRPN